MFRNFPDIFVTDFSFNFIVIWECAVYSFNSFNLLRHYWLRRWSVLVCFMGSIKIYILLLSVNIDSFESAVQIFFVFAALSTYMFFQTLRNVVTNRIFVLVCFSPQFCQFLLHTFVVCSYLYIHLEWSYPLYELTLLLWKSLIISDNIPCFIFFLVWYK